MSSGPRIALNATSLLFPLTGIGQYTFNLGKSLSRITGAPLDLFYGYTWFSGFKESGAPVLVDPPIQFVRRWVPRSYELKRFLQQRIFSAGVKKRHPDVYHEPGFLPFEFNGPTVITVHDLSWIRYPETHPRQRVAFMNRLFPRAIETAAHVLVDSEFVREEVCRQFGLARSKVTTALLAPREIFRPRTEAERSSTLKKRALTDQQYFLCVGTLEPRKNLIAALRAHAILPDSIRRRFPLVLAGMKGWLASELEGEMASGIDRGLTISLGFVCDEELANIYSGATALVYPSLYEGFGLPPLEAMACGTPAIMSNVSSLPEVGGEAALMHDPLDFESLSKAMCRLAEDKEFRLDRCRAAIAQASRFSWERCALETLAVYRMVLSKS